MKVIASIIVGVMLPFSFGPSANAASPLSVHESEWYCNMKADTIFKFKVFNVAKSGRYFNWSVSETSKGGRSGFMKVKGAKTIKVLIPDGESATFTVWKTKKQKTEIFNKNLVAAKCFD